jgi:hypothetical protein
MIAWTIFYNPLPLSSDQLLWLSLPLCLSLAVVYKTVRTKNLRRLPREVLVLYGYIILGLLGIGVGLWLLTKYCA